MKLILRKTSLANKMLKLSISLSNLKVNKAKYPSNYN